MIAKSFLKATVVIDIEINTQMQEFDTKDIGSFKANMHLYCIVVQERFMVPLKCEVMALVYEKPQ